MPISDPSYWQDLWKVIAGGLVTLGAFFGTIWTWANDRFKRVEDRVTKAEDKIAVHDTVFARVEAHLEREQEDRKEDRDSIRRLHEKIDRLKAG